MSHTLVLGGVRSGKSRLAEDLMPAETPVRYVAPGPVPGPDDAEWAARVAEHRARRPAAWLTLETGDVASVLRDDPGREGAGNPVLVDCLGTWLTRVVDDAAAWDDPAAAGDVLAARRADLVEALAACAADVVLVTNEVGLGLVPATASGRLFRDELGRLNAAVADVCDEVLLVVAGRVLDLSGAPRVDAFAALRRAARVPGGHP